MSIPTLRQAGWVWMACSKAWLANFFQHDARKTHSSSGKDGTEPCWKPGWGFDTSPHMTSSSVYFSSLPLKPLSPNDFVTIKNSEIWLHQLSIRISHGHRIKKAYLQDSHAYITILDRIHYTKRHRGKRPRKGVATLRVRFAPPTVAPARSFSNTCFVFVRPWVVCVYIYIYIRTYVYTYI